MILHLSLVVLSFTAVSLFAALVMNERRHRKIEEGLLDRLLKASGSQPIFEEPKPAPRPKAELPKRKLLFPVR